MRPRRNRSVLALAQRRGAFHAFGRRAQQSQQRHDACREAVSRGHAQHHLHRGIGQRAGQVGGGGDAGAHAQPREPLQRRLVAGQHRAVHAQHLRHLRHRLGALQLAGGQAVAPERHARMIDAAAQPADGCQRRAVAVDDVRAGVHHADRPRGRDAVQVLAHAAPVVEVDRVEAPAGQRRGGVGQRGLSLGQALQHLIERLGAGPDPAVGVAAVEPAAVDEAPERAFHQVAVAFDQPRHQHLGGQPVVQRVRRPSRPALPAGRRRGCGRRAPPRAWPAAATGSS